MIKDPPLLTVRRHFERPAKDSLATLDGVQTGHLIDAMEGRGALDFAIKAIDPSRARFAGCALTCETGPSDNLAVLAALALAEPGDVIVVAADGFERTAIVGDNVAAMARNRGIAAIVADGLVRDISGIIAVGLPVFARGVTPNSCVRSGPGRVGLPIVAGNVAIEAGDILVGDADGVVVIPRTRLAEILSRLAEVRQAEAALQARISDGLTHLDFVKELLASDRVRYVD